MAGSSVTTTKMVGALDRLYRNVYQVRLACVGDDTNGSVPDTGITGMSGYIERVEYVAGSTVPTTGFDLVLENSDGFDVLGGAGANIVSASDASFLPIQDGSNLGPVPFVGSLTMKITNTTEVDSDFIISLYMS